MNLNPIVDKKVKRKMNLNSTIDQKEKRELKPKKLRSPSPS